MQKTEFEQKYKTRLILMIIGASMTLIFSFIFLFISNILILVWASQSLKTQSMEKKVPLAVLSILFGAILGIIGGIMVLVAQETIIRSEAPIKEIGESQ
ncbi:hypothetical protein [Williamsoniiplasma luminosum]|uniref:Uncharacterized protein n=1 Tax=Williamsoniiplasma luminosum TaxID=214888 RepID=A0A2S0NKT7_9MOLU|nr:hypothetical protein [Williamsoniiplasma luminosum]AVP49615.1 MAG: hypothetical protein C5T88_03510 [Williamsoniiplasma luminosum]